MYMLRFSFVMLPKIDAGIETSGAITNAGQLEGHRYHNVSLHNHSIIDWQRYWTVNRLSCYFWVHKMGGYKTHQVLSVKKQKTLPIPAKHIAYNSIIIMHTPRTRSVARASTGRTASVFLHFIVADILTS